MKKIFTALFCALFVANAYGNPCTPTYPNNVPGTTICYLITRPGEYVPTQGAGPAPCPTGDYCPGGDKIYSVQIPERYRPVEYLENNNTAYIDTGHIPTSATTVNADVMITGGINHNAQYSWTPFLGTQQSTKERYSVGIYLNDATINFDYFIGNFGCKDIVNNYLNKRFNFKTQIQGDQIYVLLDDTELCSHQILSAPKFKYGISLFKQANDHLIRHAHGRFYSYRVYESDVLVQYMIPVFDTESEQYGMYDVVNDKFFASANDDKFTGGPVIDIDGQNIDAGGNYSCNDATDGEFISSPPKSESVTDCGRILHIGPYQIYLRRRKTTPRALAVQLGDTILYAEMTTGQCGHLRTDINGVVYSICNIGTDD